MDRQMAIENLLELYENPTHRGSMENADIEVNGGNPGCGDIIKISLRVSDTGEVEQIMFEARAAPSARRRRSLWLPGWKALRWTISSISITTLSSTSLAGKL